MSAKNAESYREMFEHLPDGLLALDVSPEGRLRVSEVNPALLALLGASREALVGKAVEALRPAELASALLRECRACLERGARVDHDLRLEAPTRTLRLALVPLRDPGSGRIHRLLGTARDLTQQLGLDGSFRHAQKLTQLGQLAAGVAHDFNNLLSVIDGNIAVAQRESLSSRQNLALREALASVRRAEHFVRQLLSFSRKSSAVRVYVDLNVLVANFADLLTQVLDGRVRLATHPTPGSALVLADPGMLEQVLMNLALNARDAMPRGGRIEIETGTVEVSADEVRGNPRRRAGPHVRVCVRDDGAGIPAEHLGRIFEPFFTTKEAGGGTGLGLATAAGIVEEHGGWIEVESAVGKGSCFRVNLPRADRPADR